MPPICQVIPQLLLRPVTATLTHIQLHIQLLYLYISDISTEYIQNKNDFLHPTILNEFHFKILSFFSVLEFELQASCMLGRCFTTSAIPLLLTLKFFNIQLRVNSKLETAREQHYSPFLKAIASYHPLNSINTSASILGA
jgi:hypothetical protein